MNSTQLQHKMSKDRITPQLCSSSIIATNRLQSNASVTQQDIWTIQNQHPTRSQAACINNIVIPFVIKHGSISIQNIRFAVSGILERHTILRTAIYLDKSHDHLLQAVQPVVGSDNYSFELTKNSVLSEDETRALIGNEFIKSFAQLDRGLVVRCHLIKRAINDDEERLESDDVIIFVLHPIAFDHHSISPFLDTFKATYNRTESDLPNVQYMDFTLYEYGLISDINQHPKINEARQIWLKLLDNYNPEVHYSLSTTSAQGTNQHSGQNYRTRVNLDGNLTKALMEFVSSHNVSMLQLGLTCFICFLHDFSSCTIEDFCVAFSTDKYPLTDMKTMIGVFIETQPCRIKINSQHSLADVLALICDLSANVCQHGQFPYKLIMDDTNVPNPAELPFHFQYYSQDLSLTEEITLKSTTDEATLCLYTDQNLLHGNGVTSNDLTLTMIDIRDSQRIQLVFECSASCYDEAATLKISQQFQNFLTYLFNKDPTINGFQRILQPISNFCLHLQTDEENRADILQIQPNLSEIGKSCFIFF